MLEWDRCAMIGATCWDALTDEMVWSESGPEVLDRTGRGGKGALEPDADGFWDDQGTAELGPLMGDAIGGLLDSPETLKGRPVCVGKPDLAPCDPLTEVLMVGWGRYAPVELDEPLANVDVETDVGEAELEADGPWEPRLEPEAPAVLLGGAGALRCGTRVMSSKSKLPARPVKAPSVAPMPCTPLR